MIALEVRPASLAERPLLQRLLQLYLYEFTDHTGDRIAPGGTYAYPYFDAYWREPGRHPFLFVAEGLPAGFAFVREVEAGWQMAEFFILRSHRRTGMGRRAARELFARFPGPWEVRELATNTDAQAFWRAVIGEVAPGFVESVDADGVVQHFVSQGQTDSLP